MGCTPCNILLPTNSTYICTALLVRTKKYSACSACISVPYHCLLAELPAHLHQPQYHAAMYAYRNLALGINKILNIHVPYRMWLSFLGHDYFVGTTLQIHAYAVDSCEYIYIITKRLHNTVRIHTGYYC